MTDLVRLLVEAVENEDPEAFGALYAEDAVMHEPMFPEPARGRDEIVAGEQALFDAFGDISIKIRTVLSEPRRVMVESLLSATNDGALDLGFDEPLPATGRRIEVPMAWAIDLDDEGLIREERDYFDTALIMTQLGLDADG
ncbi:MAG: nuclear transport factor 2 family protein [Nitriliruptorales bacterium]|nr:nuclear transport factor 2 family protein [Nitriliruptorales bacterium]